MSFNYLYLIFRIQGVSSTMLFFVYKNCLPCFTSPICWNFFKPFSVYSCCCLALILLLLFCSLLVTFLLNFRSFTSWTTVLINSLSTLFIDAILVFHGSTSISAFTRKPEYKDIVNHRSHLSISDLCKESKYTFIRIIINMMFFVFFI